MNLYHYTDLNAVHAILDTHKIRMTDIRFLNDKTEYLKGLKILKEASHELFIETRQYSEKFIETFDEWFSQLFDELLDIKYAEEMFYVASFSRSSDTLSQWRSYGMFALELDKAILTKHMNAMEITSRKMNGRPLMIYLLDCNYFDDEQSAISEAITMLHNMALGVLNMLWLKDDPKNHNQTLYKDLKDIVSMLATTFKHPCFKEEEEVRLVISDKTISDEIKFRAKNSLMIPYYEIELPPETFTSVKIGPLENQVLSEQSLVIYAAHRAAKLKADQYNLVIDTSDIPFRTL